MLYRKMTLSYSINIHSTEWIKVDGIIWTPASYWFKQKSAYSKTIKTVEHEEGIYEIFCGFAVAITANMFTGCFKINLLSEMGQLSDVDT